PFAGRRAPKPVAQKANRCYALHSTSFPCLSIIGDFGRLGSRFDFGNTGAGRLDRRWTARGRGETGAEANHPAGQDEKAGDLSTYPSGRNRRAHSDWCRLTTERCSSLNDRVVQLALSPLAFAKALTCFL